MKKKHAKGIVMKVTEKHIVLLCDGGVFHNVPRHASEFPKIGDTYTEPRRKNWLSTYSKLAAVAALFLMIAVSYTMFAPNQAEAAYVVAIDINPKVEVYADSHFHVIKVKPINSDGETIKQSLHIQGHSLFNVVQQVIESSISKGFLPKNQKGLITTTVIRLQKHLKSINKQIKDTIQQPLSRQAVNAKIYVMNGNKNLLQQSRREGLSVNQEKFYQSLKHNGVSVTPSEIRSKSMKQLDSMNSTAAAETGKSKKTNQGTKKSFNLSKDSSKNRNGQSTNPSSTKLQNDEQYQHKHIAKPVSSTGEYHDKNGTSENHSSQQKHENQNQTQHSSDKAHQSSAADSKRSNSEKNSSEHQKSDSGKTSHQYNNSPHSADSNHQNGGEDGKNQWKDPKTSHQSSSSSSSHNNDGEHHSSKDGHHDAGN